MTSSGKKLHKLKIFLLTIHLASSQTLTQCTSPSAWYSGQATPYASGSSYITDGVSHVTQIDLLESQYGGFYGVQVWSGASSLNWVLANFDTYNGVKKTFSLSATQRVTKITAYKKTSGDVWLLTSMQIDLSDGTQLIKTSSTATSGGIAYTFNTPSGQEFVGFYMSDEHPTIYETTRLAVYYRPDPCVSVSCVALDLTNIQGKTKNIFLDLASTLSFTATIAGTCSSCGALVYQTTYTPSSTTSNLITGTSSSTASVVFAASNNKLDANTYTVKVEVKFASQSTWLTSATATYQYKDPCLLATITVQSHPTITTSVLIPASSSANIWFDSVSGSAGSQKCGPFTASMTINSAPATYVAATMLSHFTQSTTSTQSTLSVSPTVVNAEAGTYVIRYNICLSNYAGRCNQFDSTVIITNCVVSSLQVVQSSGLSNLQNQAYALLSATQFNYQLTTKQTPSCGYPSSDWAITAGTTLLGSSAQYFTDANNMNAATGLYYISTTDGNDKNRWGQYTVQISSVKVNGVVYGQAQLVSPSSFVLTASTSCPTTVMTASTPNAIDLKVWDPVAFYPSSGPAFQDFTDTVSVAAGDATYCTKTYSAAISGPATITNFALDTATKTFQVYSGAYNQIGTYTVTLVGALVEDPTKTKSTTFSLNVIDPCLSTTLEAPSTPTDMTTSVSVANGAVTQQVGAFKDSVSIQNGDSSGTQYCGSRQYQISSSLGTAGQALSATELTIDANSLISVQTTNSATVGTHVITVVGKLASYSIQTSLPTFVVTILPCAVTSLQVVQCSDGANLATQTYTLNWSATLSYCLKTKQTPACNYAATDWAVQASGPVPANFQTIDATGTYTVGPTTDTAQAGSYTIQVQSVTVDSIAYGTSPAFVSPSSFILNVVNPCATSTITVSSVQNVLLDVWDAAAFYPSSGAAFTEFTDSVSDSNFVPLMCAKTYSAAVGTNSGGQSLSSFSLDTSTKKFWISSQASNQAGTYQVTLKCEITGFPSTAKTTTFNILVNDPCTTATLQQPAALNDMTTSVSVATGAVTQQVGVFKDSVSIAKLDATGTLYCGTRQYSISSVPGGGTSALTASELTIDASGLISVQTSDSTKIGIHTVTVTGKLASYLGVQLSLPTFTVTIQPCVVTSIQVVQCSDGASLAAQSYTLSSLGALSYCIQTSQTPACNYAASGWTVQANGPAPANFQTIDATGTYKVGPTTDTAQAGTYNIQVQSVTVDSITYGTSPALVSPSSFTLTVVNPCATSVITVNSVSNIVLKVGDTAAFYPSSSAAFPEFTDSVSSLNSLLTMCAKTYSATVTFNSGGASLTQFYLDNASKKFWVSSQAYNQIGTYTVTLQCQITGFPGTAKTTTFQIQVNDPCPSTTLIAPSSPLQQIETSVLVEQSPGGSPYYATRQVPTLQDQVSVLFGDLTGTQYCGLRTYQISSALGTASNALTSTELQIDSNGLISVYTARKATIGTHTVTITVSLQSHATVTPQDLLLTLEIIGCVITGFSMVPLSPTYDQTYSVADNVLSWNLVGGSLTTQVPACGYIQTLSTANTLPTFVTSSPGATISFSVFSRDVNDANIYQITVISTLNSYDFVPARQAPTCTQTFQLSISNPCLSTVISQVPVSIENFVAFAGYKVSSLQQYTFNDTESIARTLTTDSSDFCQEKDLIFSLNGTLADSNVISATNQDYIYFSPPADSQNFGLAQATVWGSMRKYLSIQSTQLSFTATILGSVVPFVADQVYILGSTTLEITYSQFQVLPANYNAGSSSVVAYLLNGQAQLPERIDFACNCLQEITGLSWINFDENAAKFSVQTSQGANIGVHKIVLVQYLDTFPDVNPFSSFSLKIEPAPAITFRRQPPYFQPQLQSQTVIQCADTLNLKLWVYTLPEILDQSNTEVSLSVSFDKAFFNFDKVSRTITQKNLTDKPVNQTIKVTLQNEFNLKATYSMLVEFTCKATPKSVVVFNYTVQEQREKVAQQKSWPNAYIQSIEPTGLMRIKFNQKMKIPDHPEYIQNETLTLEDVVYPILDMVVIPGKFSEMKQLNFNWTFVEFKTTEMLIQLNFENINVVSSHGMHKDSIQITIYGFQMFADTLGNYMSPGTILKPKKLPMMMSKEEAQAVQQVTDTTSSILKTVASVNTVVSILIAGPLQQLLSSVKQLQIIVHLQLINLPYPPPSSMFFGMLLNLLTFQFYDFGPFYSRVFKFDPDLAGSNPLNDQFNVLGYNALYIVLNFGSLCWTIFISPLLWATAPFVVKVFQGQYAYLSIKFRRMMFFNYWVGFINETYLFLAVCAGLNLHYFKWSQYGDAINCLISLFFGSIIIVFPFFVGIFYNLKNNYRLIMERDENFLERFGNVLTGLNLKRRGRLVFIPVCISLLRKLWLAYMVVFQQDYPVYSIIQVNFHALLMMITLGFSEPMTSTLANKMDLCNEAFVLITTYHLYQFTDFMTDLDNRGYVGYSLIVVTVLNVLLNLCVVVIPNIALLCRKLKLKYLQRQQQKRIEERHTKLIESARLNKIRLKIKLKHEQIARRKARAQLARQQDEDYFMAEQFQQNPQQQLINREIIPDEENQYFSRNQIQSPAPDSQVMRLDSFDQENLPNLTSEPQYVNAKFKPNRAQIASIKRKNKIYIEQPRLEWPQQVQSTFNVQGEVDYRLMTQAEEDHANVRIRDKTLNLDTNKQNLVNQRPRLERQNFQRNMQLSELEPSADEPLFVLKQKFPNLETATLTQAVSHLHRKEIKLLEVRWKGKLFRYSVVCEPYEDKFSILDGDTQSQIEDQLQRAYKSVEKYTNDLPEWIQADIRSDKFETELSNYEWSRQHFLRYGFVPDFNYFCDYGPYSKDMDLKRKVNLYSKVIVMKQISK